jgi:CheY-like chemotaxis protein
MARILVIDDEALVREAMCAMLRAFGHEVADAEDGEAGLDLASVFPPHLVICDIIMPRLDGIATIRALKADYPDLPIVAISGGERGADSRDTLRRAAQAGADLALAKPFSPHDFLAAVDRAIAIDPPARRVAV